MIDLPEPLAGEWAQNVQWLTAWELKNRLRTRAKMNAKTTGRPKLGIVKLLRLVVVNFHKLMNDSTLMSEDDLGKNFAYWSRQYASERALLSDNDRAEFANRALKIAPTTHTFGQRSEFVEELHKKVFFEDGGLLSEFKRLGSGSLASESHISDNALDFGLNKYVFTYLGVHEPWYARTYFPAFGIFVRTTAEEFPYCIATRRDLKSDEVNSSELRKQFLRPNDARQLALYELSRNRHNGDFFHYWGNPVQWCQNQEYVDNHWKWVYEFHFYEKLSVPNFHAILWPREKMVASFSNEWFPTEYTNDQEEFKKLYPDCRIICYEPSISLTPQAAFVTASQRAIEYFVKKNEFPKFVS